MGRRKKIDAGTESVLCGDRTLPDGRRKIMLRDRERHALVMRQRAERAATLFLDIEHDRTWASIAQEMGLSAAQLRDITKTQEFDTAYNALFAEVGHDPRFRAAQAALGDMLPIAVRELKNILVGSRTPPGIKLRAIEKILTLNGLAEQKQTASDRQELAKFLVDNRVQTVNVNVPAEFQTAMQGLLGTDIVDVTPRSMEISEITSALPEKLDSPDV